MMTPPVIRTERQELACEIRSSIPFVLWWSAIVRAAYSIQAEFPSMAAAYASTMASQICNSDTDADYTVNRKTRNAKQIIVLPLLARHREQTHLMLNKCVYL